MKKLGCLLSSPFAVTLLLIGLLFTLLAGLLSALFGTGANNAPVGPANTAIAQNALQMAEHLHDGGTYGFDVIMDAGFPQPALDFWDSLCGHAGCGRALSGNLQCGQFVGMAYGWAGLPLVGANTVIEWWTDYAAGRQPGWVEIPNGQGQPQPGDILMLDTPNPGPFAGEGHAGIVVSVQHPVAESGLVGSLLFAEANGPTPFVTMPLEANGALDMLWQGYTVKGFLRHVTAQAMGTIATITVRHDQLDPAEYDATGFFTWANWAYSACSAGAMTNVIDGYGHNYRIVDILKVEYRLGEITPQLGLQEEAGIARTAAQFGLSDVSTTTDTLEQVVGIAQAGNPVIVDFPPDRYPKGHLLVVTGGLVGSDGKVVTVYVVDSGFDRSSITRSQFLQWWSGQADILTPKA